MRKETELFIAYVKREFGRTHPELVAEARLYGVKMFLLGTALTGFTAISLFLIWVRQ